MGRIKKIVINKILTDDQVSSLEGTFIDESFIKYPIITNNIDVYYLDDDNNEKLLLKFRKNRINNSLVRLGWKSYKDLAKPSRGRGASAGPIDKDSVYWKKRSVVNTKKWSTGYLKSDGDISKMKVNNQVASNPIGYYESSNNFCKLPCRLTHFTRTNFEKYNDGLPFIQKIDSEFQRLIPDAYQKQLDKSNLKPKLKIPNTAFSTITINRNFRTALHRDAGDYKGGFGNLSVIERGQYHGGYTCFPQFGVAVDCRSGDFLAMDVHHWHSNTPIYETKDDLKYNQSIEKVFNDNPEVGTVGLEKLYTRLTFVCYLRDKMSNCPDEIDPQFLTASGPNKLV